MKIAILDVEHGFCSVGRSIDGSILLIDCGHGYAGGVAPSGLLAGFGVSSVKNLVVSNFDEDHVSDLPILKESVGIDLLTRNPSVSSDQLREMKLAYSPWLALGTRTLLELMDDYWCPPEFMPSGNPEFPDVRLSYFWNIYPGFEDTNNLSLVTFLQHEGFTIIFPGDLEREGWLNLLLNPVFRYYLSKVNIFVASHHGRESGYCREVFDWCHPDVILISDGPIKYESQGIDYSRHARGILWYNSFPIPARRSVLTTRADGHLIIGQRPDFKYWIDSLAN